MHSLTLAVMMSLAGGVGQHPEPIAPLEIQVPADGIRLPMVSKRGKSLVEGRLNGEGPYRFYFDSGAAQGVIDASLAKKLKAEVVGDVGIMSGGDAPGKKPIPGKLVRIDRIELDAAKLGSVTLASMDLSRLGKQGPVGVLSAALLPGYLVTWDYPKKEVRIHAGQLPTADNKTVFDYLPGHPIPGLPIKVAEQSLDAHLDSGSDAGLMLPMKLAKSLPLYSEPVDTGKKAKSVRGAFPVYRSKLKGKCCFGQYSLTDPAIEFSDVVRNGNLGSGVLDGFILTLDFKNRRFQLLKGA
jgi:hypothetical protein